VVTLRNRAVSSENTAGPEASPRSAKKLCWRLKNEIIVRFLMEVCVFIGRMREIFAVFVKFTFWMERPPAMDFESMRKVVTVALRLARFANIEFFTVMEPLRESSAKRAKYGGL
jgi:hypothetical protein